MNRLRLFILIAFLVLGYSSYSVNSIVLAWDGNPENDLAGYIVYYGAASRNYTNAVNVWNFTTNEVSGLVDGATYFFAVTAYNTNGLKSEFSDEVSYSVLSSNVVVLTIQPILSMSNVVLKGSSSVSGLSAWFDLSEGTNTTDWRQVPALGPTNQVYWAILTTNQMASYWGSRPTNWTYRFSVSDAANTWSSAPLSFEMMVPVPKRLRIIMRVFEAAGLAGPWKEVLVYTVTNIMMDPPKIYRSQYTLQILPDNAP